MRLLLVSFLGLAGCPPPTTYLIAEVSANHLPVADAVVAADCGNVYADAARRTDPAGRAQLEFRRGRIDASKCSLTIAAPGFDTIEASGLSLCTTPACPTNHVELDPRHEPSIGTVGPIHHDVGQREPIDPYDDTDDSPIVPNDDGSNRRYATPPQRGTR